MVGVVFLAGGGIYAVSLIERSTSDATANDPGSLTTDTTSASTLTSTTSRSASETPSDLSVVVEPATDRDFERLGYEPLWWSPDGAWVLASGDGEVCALSTFGSDDMCFDWEGRVDGPAWSPDSRRVAFSENSWEFSEEADIWVLDTSERTLTNWTEDHVPFDGDGGPHSDFWPVWTEGDLAFFRFTRAEEKWSVVWIPEPIGVSAAPDECLFEEGLVPYRGGLVDFGDGTVGANLWGAERRFEICGPDGTRSTLRLDEDPEWGVPDVMGRLPDDRLVLFYYSRSGAAAMQVASADGEERWPIVHPYSVEEARRATLDGPHLLVVDDSGTKAAVVTNIGAPEGFGEVGFAGRVHSLDLRDGRQIDVTDAPPIWEQEDVSLEPGHRGMKWYGGHYRFTVATEGTGVVVVAGPPGGQGVFGYHRISFGER